MTHIDQEVNNETIASNTTTPSEQETKMDTTTKTTIQVLRDFPLPGVDEKGKRRSTQELRDVTYSPDELTVITSGDRDKVYTKINVFDDVKFIGKVSFSNQFLHTAKNVPVPNLGVLEAELRKMNDNTTSCVILGQLFDELTGSTKLRRIKNGDWEVDKYAAKSADGKHEMKWAPHCFTEVPRSWACFDVDGKGDAEVIFPGAHLWTDKTPAAERAQQTAQWLVNVWMPKDINHKDAVVQWSSSYALDGRLERVRAHVWVRFSAPLTCQQLTSWALLWGPKCAPDGKQYIATKPDGTHIAGGRRLDFSTVRHGVHPNFTAAPVFNRGGELIPHKTRPGEYEAVKGGTTFPDPHHDYRIVRVNGRGTWGNVVDAAPFIAAGQAAEAAKAAKQKRGTSKGPKVETVQAPVSTVDWSAKDRADYELARECLSFLGSDVYGPYDEWFATGCSIKSRFPGPEGLALWTEWSLQWEGSDPLSTPDVCEGFWNDISPTRASGPSRGFGRLIVEAQLRGMPTKTTKTTKTTEPQNMNENTEAPVLPAQVAALEADEFEPKGYPKKCLAVATKLMLDRDFLTDVKVYFTYYGKDRLARFVSTIAERGCSKETLKKLARALTPRSASSVTLPTYNGVEIEFNEVEGFTVSNEGIFRVSWGDEGQLKETPVLAVPLFVVSEDSPLYESGTTPGVGLCWRDRRTCVWKTHRFANSDVADRNRIVPALTQLCVPVTSTTAAQLVDYIEAYRSSNAANIEVVTTTSRMGWLDVGGKTIGFMLGSKFIKMDPDAPDVVFSPPTNAARVDAELYAQTSGTFEDWCAMLAKVAKYPAAMLMVYSSMAAPLLKIMASAAQGFTLDMSGKTSRGKTTAIHLAASAWGHSQKNGGSSLAISWNATAHFIDAKCAATDDLPLFLDDTAQIPPNQRSSLIRAVQFMVTNGSSRSRSDNEGKHRETTPYRKVLISTGESGMLEENTVGGAVARVVTCDLFPFGEQNPETYKELEGVIRAYETNYGHLGERYITALCDGTFDWSELRKQHAAYMKALEGCGGDDGVLTRLGSYIALIRLCGDLLSKLTGLSLDVRSHVDLLWERTKSVAVESDPTKAALEQALSYITSADPRLEGSKSAPSMGNISTQGWVGKVSTLEDRKVVYLCTHPFDTFLTANGHTPGALRKAWAQAGVLVGDKNSQQLLRQSRIGGQNQRCYCLDMAAVEAYLGLSVPTNNT
jgi:uncharacterized protein (DUF927 family)